MCTDARCVIVADGITRTKGADGSYPDPSPSATAAQIFCHAVQRAILERSGISSLDDLRAVVTEGNAAIHRFNQEILPHPDFAERDRAGVAAVVGAFHDDELLIASIADCWSLGFSSGEARRFAWEKTSHSRPEYNRLGEPRARELLRNRVDHPFAYGAFTGEPASLAFVEYNRIAVPDVRRVIFASDGLLRVAQEKPEPLERLSGPEIIKVGRLLDHTYNETDDKTIVILDRMIES